VTSLPAGAGQSEEWPLAPDQRCDGGPDHVSVEADLGTRRVMAIDVDVQHLAVAPADEQSERQ